MEAARLCGHHVPHRGGDRLPPTLLGELQLVEPPRPPHDVVLHLPLEVAQVGEIRAPARLLEVEPRLLRGLQRLKPV